MERKRNLLPLTPTTGTKSPLISLQQYHLKCYIKASLQLDKDILFTQQHSHNLNIFTSIIVRNSFHTRVVAQYCVVVFHRS